MSTLGERVNRMVPRVRIPLSSPNSNYVLQLLMKLQQFLQAKNIFENDHFYIQKSDTTTLINSYNLHLDNEKQRLVFNKEA